MINIFVLILLVLYGLGCYLAYKQGYEKGWTCGYKNCLNLLEKIYSSNLTTKGIDDDEDNHDDNDSNLAIA
jgi:hypothetical protein